MTTFRRLSPLVKAVGPALVLAFTSAAAFVSAADRPSESNRQAAQTVAAPTVRDVSLDRQGRLAGCVTDVQGLAVRRTTVVLERISPAGRTLADRVVTDDAGRFQSRPLAAGSYVASAAGGHSAVRAWRAEAAPPAANRGLMIVADEQALRGQSSTNVIYEFIEARPALTYGAIATAIVVPIVEISDDDDRPRGS
jgi:hypothetical protein